MTASKLPIEQTAFDLGRYMAFRLKPLAVGIALAISLLFPCSYFIVGYNHLRQTASVLAESFSARLKWLIVSDSDLWKYQTQKYLQLLQNFSSGTEIMRVRVLDEKGQAITDYGQVNTQLTNFLPVESPVGHASIYFNNRNLGTVEMALSLNPLLRTTAVLFLMSSCIGTGLAFRVYYLPIQVVRRQETDIRGLITTIQDAKRASDRLRMVAQASEQRFREFVQGLDAIVWEADAETWRFSFVSQQTGKILGYPAELWLAEPRFPMKYIHPGDQERVLACYQLAILEESGFQLEYRLIAADGREVWIQDFVRISRSDETGSCQMSGIMVDITERKKGEEVLAEQARELARSNAELEQFAYVASHDLQEPLRMISGYVQLIARRYKDRLDNDGKEFIAFAVDGATQMQRLIRDLLTYSRVGTRGSVLTPMASTDAFNQALANLRLVIEESSAIVSNIPLPEVMGDATQLTQLFQNLLANAIKFRGTHAPRIQVGAKTVGDEWRFWVRDNGMGIAPEYFDRIFLIFQRLSNRTQYSGTGIGLAVCKKIVERHGGRIWIESVPDEGATFYFTLPVIKGERT